MSERAWRESDHPRDWAGRFTHNLVGRWGVEMSNRLNETGLKRGDRRPPGFDAAVARHRRLWSIPEDPANGGEGRDRTDAEHQEAEELDEAFRQYRELLGLNDQRWSAHGVYYTDDMGRKFDEYGRRFGAGPGFDAEGRVKARTRKFKDRVIAPKREDMSHLGSGDSYRQHWSEGGKIGRRYTDITDGGTEAAAVMVAWLKRMQPRARMEGSARRPVRRTPRGTQVDGWMNQVNARINGSS